MHDKAVLIVGNFSFPKGNAAGKRVLGLGYLFEELGYRAVFAGCQCNRGTNIITDTKKEYENFTYYNFNGNRCLKNICNVSNMFNEFRQIAIEVGIENIALIVIYGSPALALWIQKIISYGKKWHIPIVFDCVDWIEKSGFNNAIKNAIKYIDTNYMKRYLACKCDGVIAISRYLYDYYKGKGCKTVLIPPIGKMESKGLHKSEKINIENKKNNCVRFVYAGSIPLIKSNKRDDWKDRIDLTVEIMSKLHEQGINYIFDIFGIEKTQYITAVPEHETIIDKLESIVKFHGKTSNDKVCNYIRDADFTILNRVATKVTTAGFPSKVSESMLLGTPVITNDTSNIVDYIKNGENGLIIDFDTNKAASEVFALCADRSQIMKMKNKCKMECCFDSCQFKVAMKNFIDGL